ncbi:MAG TPA: M56 family metallopeptidase [Pyrinomonadaceae bacterium]|nr:M56 family metallopeptidase [Pyrinomonadaceae bacterium]
MKTSSDLLLTFLLNACWQVVLIAALASFGSWLLRNSVARYRHWLWVSALCLAFLVPALTSLQTLAADSITTVAFTNETIPPLVSFEGVPATTSAPTASTFQLSKALGFALLAIFGAFLIFRIFKLVHAWQTTRRIRRAAVEIESNDEVAQVLRTCELELGTPARAKVLCSETLPVPVTIGLFQPVIILPEPLLREGNPDLLKSAIGHELIHVARRDYLLNFIYELLFVPISFHPAAALLRRRVKETRELCCDELVAERILKPEIYARSLVRLASSAPPLRSLSVTTTVGIADADILEARIMSLLRKPELKTRWKKLLLFTVSMLLLVPCVAAAAFAMRFEVQSQDPAAQEAERKDREKQVMKMRGAREEQTKERMAQEPFIEQERMRKRETELEMRDVMHAALVRLAKINMDQAIQIATSQQPGKVLLCSLGAKGWEEPGKLGKDGVVFYHVIIADEVNPGSTHMYINAIDGTIIKTEKELPRKTRSPEGN